MIPTASVMNPGMISNTPPTRISAPSSTARPGGRRASGSARSRVQAARPWDRSAQLPAGQLAIRSRKVSSQPIAPATWIATNTSATGQRIRRTSSSMEQAYLGPPARPGSLGLGQGRRGPLELHAGEPVQADELDQQLDLRLGAAQPQLALTRAQAAGQGGQVEHQRGVS